MTVTRPAVLVTAGVFTVTQLDFGTTAFPAAADRWLEISVRLNGSGNAYTVLSPRQQVNSVPFAVRSLTATNADNATNLAGVTASNYVQTSDTRLSDARTPTAGSTDYVQNGTSPQSLVNFNIAGDGTANTFTAATQYNVDLNRVLTVNGLNFTNTFLGVQAGNQNPTGNFNSFFGNGSGKSTTTGGNNSFYGSGSGIANASGSDNAFFGRNAGIGNTASQNSFFGGFSGAANRTGTSNAFFGFNSGLSNTTGDSNTLIGNGADVGASNLSFATAIGASAVVSSSNSVVLGRNIDTVQIPGFVIASGSFSRFDLSLVATLRWDLLSQRTFPVGSSPMGVAFDGANMWVTGSLGRATKLRASNGASIENFDAGSSPQGIAFDGANMWVTNGHPNTVTKLPVLP